MKKLCPKVVGIEITDYTQTSDSSASAIVAPETTIKLALEDQGWELQKPIQYEADQTAVANFKNTLYEFKFDKIVAQNKNQWPKFGLDKPRRIVTLIQDEETKKYLQIFLWYQSTHWL